MKWKKANLEKEALLVSGEGLKESFGGGSEGE